MPAPSQNTIEERLDQKTTFTNLPPLITMTRLLFSQSCFSLSHSLPSAVSKTRLIIQSCSSCVGGAFFPLAVEVFIGGMVTAHRVLPLTCTATFCPPRAERVSASSVVRRVLGQGDLRIDGTCSLDLFSSVSWRTSQDSDESAGAIGARRR